MHKAKDWNSILYGKTFNYLTVIEQGQIHNNKQKILTRCVCGKEKYILVGNILSGSTKSCGCKKSDIISNTNTKHGMRGLNGIYNIFRGMKARCENKNGKDYGRYGGRGIKCLRESFEDFYQDMGESYNEHCNKYGKANTTIERINNDGNYCKDNCKRATRKVQANNRSDNHIISYYGKKYTITELSKIIGKDHSYVKRELDKGLNIYDIAKKNRKGYIIS